MAKKNWIPKDLKKGRCTPAPMTFKKHKGWKKEMGGSIIEGSKKYKYQK